MSQAYLIPCECGQKTAVVPSQAGQEIACSCGKILHAPKFRDFANLEKVEAPTKQAQVKTWNPILGSLAAILFFASLLSFGNSAYYGYWRSFIDTSYTVDDELRQGEENIDKLTPAEVWSLYKGFSASGLGRKNPPGFYINILDAELFEQKIKFYGIAGAISLTLGLVLIVASRGKKKA